MDKKLKITIIICILVVAVTAAVLWWYDNKSKKTDPSIKTDGANTTPGSETPTGEAVSVFPLRKGSKCAEVGVLQAKMNGWMNFNYFTLTNKPSKQQLVTDKIFGAKTLEFVRIIFKKDEVSKADYDWLMNENYTSTEKPLWQIF